MKYLHDDLDHDDDGNVSLTEGAQVINARFSYVSWVGFYQ